MTNSSLSFTNNWFKTIAESNWDILIPQFKPEKILEIGSYEGAATCYLIEKLSSEKKIEIYCIDTWTGGVEHNRIDMQSVENRFDQNIEIVKSRSANQPIIKKIKGASDLRLSELIASGHKNYFDFVYIDASHQASDVLFDAVAAFRLTRIGGLIAFDDYLWSEHYGEKSDLLQCPKAAIDAFTSLYWRKIRIVQAPLYQMYVQKLSD